MHKPSRRPKPGLWTRKDRKLGSGLSSEGSGGSPIALWRDGVVLALIPILLGLVPLITGHFAMSTRGGRLVLDGLSARALGVAAIALGACVHFHFFWDAHEDLSPYSQSAQILAILVFFGALGTIAYATFGSEAVQESIPDSQEISSLM
jgi:hypothetical protein